MSGWLEQLNTHLGLGISTSNTQPLKDHLEFVELVESCLKIGDYFVLYSPVSLNTPSPMKNRQLCRQFKNIGSHIEFLRKMYDKRRLDGAGDTSDWDLRTILDLDNLEKKSNKTYVHYNWKDDLSLSDIENTVTYLVANGAKAHQRIFIWHTNKQLLQEGDPNRDQNKSRLELLEKKFSITICCIPIDSHNEKIENYNKTFFNINLESNNIYLINKILVARMVLFDLIKARGYTGAPSYVYFDQFNDTFGHFGMDLDTRFTNSRSEMPISERNYFDIYGIYREKDTPVYIHFVTGNKDATGNDLNLYINKIAPEIRQEILSSTPAQVKDKLPMIHLILVINKKATAKNSNEQFGVEDKDNNLIYDVIQLENLQYNPLNNVYQPKFRLIKKRTPEYKKILQHYGLIDAIPRILYRDPVNKFFGGEHNDLYEVVRTEYIKIHDNRDTQLHLDVTYRIVK
jgi:DNA-directed RNA polymerase subunit H (RpoH/RPB5)